MKSIRRSLSLLLLLTLLVGCGSITSIEMQKPNGSQESQESGETMTLADVPEYDGEPYVAINDNKPEFEETDFTTESYEYFSELDSLDRCGMVMACVGKDLMPTEEREYIGMVRPSGWQSVRYSFVDGESLYNRCHLLGFQLTGENANERNLITGTRYLNTQGMLPFENMVADYVRETGNHVLYRVTPIFEDDNLVASGVQLEGYSVEDAGESICFNVYAYNVQPGISIDYATGDSELAPLSNENGARNELFIINTNNRKFHKPDCLSVIDIKDENKNEYEGTRDILIAQGFEPCGRCNP